MHKEQQEFCLEIKKYFPDHFKYCRVLDCGSQDINGNNRYLFEECIYTGIDIGPGPNVDEVTPIHLYKHPHDRPFDTIISTECFEHDPYLEKSLQRIMELLKPGGLFLFTCATTGRGEHGTHKVRPGSSPHTNHYYKNVTEADVRSAIDMEDFIAYGFRENKRVKDLYFWGVKKGAI